MSKVHSEKTKKEIPTYEQKHKIKTKTGIRNTVQRAPSTKRLACKKEGMSDQDRDRIGI